MTENTESERQNRKERLLEYYKFQSMDNQIEQIYNIDSSEFDYEAYLKKILKEENLITLMDKEKDLMSQIRNLDSEMQTLVYDNYNKFIYATDTIKNMKNDFQYVEDEMNKLGEQINSVNTISKTLQTTISPKRDELQKLYGTHQLLKRLEYLFELPDRLRNDIKNKQYLKAVRSHSKAQSVLDRYHDLPSFEGIRNDCNKIIEDLKLFLWTKFDNIDIDVQELSSVVLILDQLHEPKDKLAQCYLSYCQKVMEAAFELLKDQLKIDCEEDNPFIPDILHFANITTELVLDKLSSQLSVYEELFLQSFESNDVSIKENSSSVSLETLTDFVLDYLTQLMDPFLLIVQKRLNKEKEKGDTTMLARAMDRIHSRLQALQKLVPTSGSNNKSKQVDLAQIAIQLVCDIAHERCQFYSHLLARQLNDCITDIRQRLSASQVGSGGSIVVSTNPETVATTTQTGGTNPNLASDDRISSKNNSIMQKLLNSLSDALVEQLKATLNAQQAFIDTDNTFSKKIQFQVSFCLHDIRESLFVGFINNIINYCNDLANQTNIGSSFCPLLLILGKFCQNWADQGVLDYLLTIVDEQFLVTTIKNTKSVKLTNVQKLVDELRQSSLQLINAYVRVQGNCLSQMIRKSVDTRDWLNCVEPRSVRSVMKRVVEDMAQIDVQVSQLLPSNQRLGNAGDHSSDHSSRRPNYHHSQHFVSSSISGQVLSGGGMGIVKSNTTNTSLPNAHQTSSANWGYAASNSNNIHSSDRFLSNISKLFAEKIHIFAPVVAIRESVLTGIVRIALKTFMECVRLKTFGKYGLQQVQVDCRYLQIHLWRFVNDEKLIHTLLDDVIGSVVNRCVDPVYMDDSIIELVCES